VLRREPVSFIAVRSSVGREAAAVITSTKIPDFGGIAGV
jgi:hypothetical protein